MNARQSNACLLSALLHGTVVALLLLLGYAFSQSAPDTVKVFELVAGAGDNYAATEAPALGVPGGIKVKVTVPAPPAPVPEPARLEAAPPVPVPAPAPVPVSPPKVPPPAATSPAKSDEVPNFKKIEQRAASRKAAHLEWVYKRQLAAEKKKQESYAEFLKEQNSKAPATHSSSSTKVPKVGEGIAAGVAGGSTANKTGGAGGKALSREQQDLLDSYFAMLKSRLKENHVPPPGVSDKLEAYLEFVVAADGSISHLRFLRSSGNAEFDDSVREAFAHTHMPARPDGRTDTRTLTFRLHDDDAE